MDKSTKTQTLSKKNTIIALIVICAVVLVGMIAMAAGHVLFLDNQKAQITNLKDFRIISVQELTYIYEDGQDSVDFGKIVSVNKGASFSIVKIIDEDTTVSPSETNVVSVVNKPIRHVVVRIKSVSKNKTVDYRITIVPQSLADNVINAQLGDAFLNGDILSNYSGTKDFELPNPIKNYVEPSGDVWEYQFMGWYTTETFEEDSQISTITAGTQGQINLYPKFAPPAPQRDSKDGFVYIAFGKYPQTKVTDYNLLKEIRASSNFVNASNGATFSYSGQEYYKFKPKNVPNLSDNGYSSSSYYVFMVEPIIWRVLAPKNNAVTNGTNYTLLSKYILNCSAFRAGSDGFIAQQYAKYSSQLNGDLTGFLRLYYDSDTVYESSDLRKAINSIYSNWIAPNESTAQVRPRTFQKYKDVVSTSKENYTVSAYALNYSEMVNTSYGFNSSWEETDLTRQASITDFALANGVYTSTNKAYMGKGTWWLRGAGSTFDYSYKKIAYVKYTGKLHSFTSANYSLRSGVRVAMNVQSWFAVA